MPGEYSALSSVISVAHQGNRKQKGDGRVGLFGKSQLPVTSYGYQPPQGATAKGWKCTNIQTCGNGGNVPPRRWPLRCPRCGQPCDPIFDEPWAHPARGMELNWQLRNDPVLGGQIAQQQLMAWNLKDALLRRDARAATAARAVLRDYVSVKQREGGHWDSLSTMWQAIRHALDAGDLDGAADDLCFWLSVSTGKNAENDNEIRTNARTVISSAGDFLNARGGPAHPRAAEIRQGCLRIAEDSFKELNLPQQAVIMRMTRA